MLKGTDGLSRHLKACVNGGKIYFERKLSVREATKPRSQKTLSPHSKKPSSVKRDVDTLADLRHLSSEEIATCFLSLKARWVAASNRPLTDVEDETLNQLLHCAGILYSKTKDVTSLQHSKQDVEKRVEDLAARSSLATAGLVSQEIVSLTTDSWTGANGKTYAMVVANWINSRFEACESMLSLEVLEDSADRLVQDLEKSLVNSCIKSSNVCAVVTTMKAFGSRIRDQYEAHPIPCAAHVLQQLADVSFQSVVGSSTGAKEHVLTKARATVAFFDCRTESMGKLNVYRKFRVMNEASGLSVERLLLKLDDDSLWWSTYNMIDRLLEFQSDIAEFTGLATEAPPTMEDSEWDLLRDLHDLLSPLIHAREFLQGESSRSITLVRHMAHIVRVGLTKLMGSSKTRSSVRETASEMIRQLNSSYGPQEPGSGPEKFHPAIQIATFCDPNVRGLIAELSRDPDSSEAALVEKVVAVGVALAGGKVDSAPKKRKVTIEDYCSREAYVVSGEEKDSYQTETALRREVEAYLGLQRDQPIAVQHGFWEDKRFKVLEWWRHFGHQWPLLSRVARAYLAIPVVSTSQTQRPPSNLPESTLKAYYQLNAAPMGFDDLLLRKKSHPQPEAVVPDSPAANFFAESFTL